MTMYANFGNARAARHVFDQMPQRNNASWNSIISGCIRAGWLLEAFEWFRGMRCQGFRPNRFVLASLASGCNRSLESVSVGIQIHGLVAKVGLLRDVYVSSAILHLYGLCGFVFDVQRFFDEMPERNVVSWTSLMVGYSKNGNPKEAVNAYRQMRWEGVEGNQNSFATVISSCGLLKDQLLGSQVLGLVVVSGFETNVSVTNALISMFDSFGRVEDAVYVFSRMEDRDTISWNAMISTLAHKGLLENSLACFQEMCFTGVPPDSTTISSLLSGCSCTEELKWGSAIHSFAIKSGHDSTTPVCNCLITMYSVTARFEDAELLFLLMPERDLISWNSMMTCLVQSGQLQNALELLAELLRNAQGGNHVTFAGLLAAFSGSEALIGGKMVHAVIIILGFQENLLTGNALVSMYGNCCEMVEAERVFLTMAETDVVSWNAMIGGCAENKEQWKAMKYFNFMRTRGINPNYITIVNVLAACLSPEDLKYGMSLHGLVLSGGLISDDYVKNSLLAMYAKCRSYESSYLIFSGLVEKTVVSWNAMITANVHHGYCEEALKLFMEMRNVGLDLDHFSFSGALAASANLALLEEGQQLYSLIIKLGFESDLHVINAAMDMYGKCGKMDDVLKILPKSNKRSRLTLNILISGYARQGNFEKAREVFNEMLDMGVTPDYVTFVSLLSACNHAGLVDKGLAFFESMTREFGILPGIEHCVCIVDLLGRSGRLGDAERFIEDMPVAPNDLIWRSLLAACRTHGNLELGRQAAQSLLEMDPSDDSAYVLLSNAYAINRRWDDVEKLRRYMELNNVKKKPACSWIKVKNEVSSFGTGDRTHPQTKQIYAKLEDLLQMVKGMGYVADTTFVLHDTDDEQKEHNLWNHSEKLALAFGLISTPEGSPLRIFKNLRVCGDCHSAYKLISQAVGREIILRDSYRFHHFSCGACTCADYW